MKKQTLLFTKRQLKGDIRDEIFNLFRCMEFPWTPSCTGCRTLYCTAAGSCTPASAWAPPGTAAQEPASTPADQPGDIGIRIKGLNIYYKKKYCVKDK